MNTDVSAIKHPSASTAPRPLNGCQRKRMSLNRNPSLIPVYKTDTQISPLIKFCFLNHLILATKATFNFLCSFTCTFSFLQVFAFHHKHCEVKTGRVATSDLVYTRLLHVSCISLPDLILKKGTYVQVYGIWLRFEYANELITSEQLELLRRLPCKHRLVF